MAPAMKVMRSIGVILIFTGIIALSVSGSNEEIDALPQVNDLVINQKSGEFTTSYNSSWDLEIWVLNECGNIEMEIRDSQNIIVYNDEMYCNQMENGEMPSFTHVMNETYTFESNSNLDIIIYNQDDLGIVGILEALGALSCCFGVILTIFSGIVGLAAGNNASIGMMPVQMGTNIPDHTNVHNQGNVQMTQTYMTQPTIVEETSPSPITSVDDNVRQEKLEEFNPPKEKKSNFWDNVD